MFEEMTEEDWAKVHTAKRWEKMEAWLFDTYEDREGQFTNQELAQSLDVSNQEASRLIRAYVDAQRRANASTLYVLKREGRTASAMWSVGQRKMDVRIRNDQQFDDIVRSIERAYIPDLARYAARNPRLARYTWARVAAVLDGAMAVLAASLDTADFEE